MSCRVVSFRVILYRIASCCVVSCPFAFCSIIPGVVLFRLVSCRVVSYLMYIDMIYAHCTTYIPYKPCIPYVPCISYVPCIPYPTYPTYPTYLHALHFLTHPHILLRTPDLVYPHKLLHKFTYPCLSLPLLHTHPCPPSFIGIFRRPLFKGPPHHKLIYPSSYNHFYK